jgi:hypothetical protein
MAGIVSGSCETLVKKLRRLRAVSIYERQSHSGLSRPVGPIPMQTLRVALANWTDFDVSAHMLAQCLGSVRNPTFYIVGTSTTGTGNRELGPVARLRSYSVCWAEGVRDVHVFKLHVEQYGHAAEDTQGVGGTTGIFRSEE